MGADIKEIGDVLAPHAANDEDRQRDKRFRAALAEATRLQREGYYQGAFDGRTGPKLRQPLERWRNVGSLFPNNG